MCTQLQNKYVHTREISTKTLHLNVVDKVRSVVYVYRCAKSGWWYVSILEFYRLILAIKINQKLILYYSSVLFVHNIAHR